jgi:hypothetical protein
LGAAPAWKDSRLWRATHNPDASFSGFGPEGLRVKNHVKTMSCRERSFRATSQNFDASHNLKVVGSNPTPATKIHRVIKRLRAALRGGVCVSSARGSTVEARRTEVLHATAKNPDMHLDTRKNPMI